MEHTDGTCDARKTPNTQRPNVKVAHLLSGREGGGIATVVSSLVRSFNPDVIEASVLLLSRNSLLGDERYRGCKFHTIRKGFRGNLIAVLRIVLHCLKRDIDILHTHSISTNFYGRLAGILMPRTAVITTVHARTLHELRGAVRHKILSWCIWRTDSWMARYSRQIIAISEWLRKELIAEGVPHRKIHTVRHGICLNNISVTAQQVEEARRALNIDRRKKIVGIVGRLTRVKNHALCIQACKEVALKHPDLLLLIVGDGPLRNDLEILVRDLLMSEMTIFTGWISKIYPILHLLDVLVVSSSSEGFGYILLEGMACGKAIVATQVSEIPHIIENGKTGMLVPPNDVNGLAKAIDFLLGNPQKRKEMGEFAKKEVAKRFPLEREVKKTTEIYLSVLGPDMLGKQSRTK